MTSKFKFPEDQAGIYSMIPYLVCGCVMAPLGIFIEKYGCRKYIILGSGVFQLSGLVIFYLIPGNCLLLSIMPWIFHGLWMSSYYVCQWGSVPSFVDEKQVSIAYGIIACF